MPSLRLLLQPLNLAGLLTLGAVALSLRDEGALVWALLGLYVLLFFAHTFIEHHALARGRAVLAVQAVVALAIIGLAPGMGTAPVLLVVLLGQAVQWLSPRALLGVGIALVLALWLLLARAGHSAALIVTLVYAGFMAFATLIGHYAETATRSRDALARVNADLLATRALLADSARDTERLRVARELHDVAGHSLTALTLNLRALAADPALAARPELRVAQDLAANLMGELRSVVRTLRAAPGLDLATALRALAAPLPRPALQLDIADDVRVDAADRADALLRIVQEALTNAARHGDARVLHVQLQREGDGLRLEIGDDGRLRGPLRAGHGLTGMRERIEALGGTLALDADGGRLVIRAWLPA